MPNIKIEDLRVTFTPKKKTTVTALDGINLDLKEDTFNVVVGYSGCGKTTLLRCLSGLQDYDGKIYFDGVDMDDVPTQKRNTAMVSQNYVLYPKMTIFENIAFPLLIAGAPKGEIVERVNEVAERLGIKHCLSRKPKHLSGGQQQRVAIARALVKKPTVYLFDEPFSNFDYPTRIESKLLIRKIVKDTQATAVYVTHDFSEAVSIADHLIVINDGKVEIEGDPLDVYNSDNEVVKSLKGIVDEELLESEAIESEKENEETI